MSETVVRERERDDEDEEGSPSVVDLEAVLGDRVVRRDDHENAPAVVVRPDDVAESLAALRDRLDLDHCSCVTAQEYADRFETIYHLKDYDDPTREASVVVPTTHPSPVSESGASAFRTCDWHEREAFDLLGVEYAGHPDLRRILLPRTWQGHPLRESFDGQRPQVVTLEEHANPLADDARTSDGADPGHDTMFLNVGPHHPSTHGVLHVRTVLDGETVVDVEPDIGYIHRCEEQMCQTGTYRHQIMPYPDRWDWASAGLLNEWAYARAIESLADVDVPEYAQVIRTMGAELCRIASHMLAIATYALDVFGEFTAVFQYGIRDRERALGLLEELTGQRMMFNYFRVGGVAWDLPAPREAFFEQVRSELDTLPGAMDEYYDLLASNEVFQSRTMDTGHLDVEVAKTYGVTGPVARGSGIDYDLRRDDPYGYYENLDWEVVTEPDGDNLARVLVRLQEVEQSASIVRQCVDVLESWPEDDRTVQSNVPRTLKPPADAETYRAVEGAKGELGIYLRSDGTDSPARFKIRSPCFSNLHALPEMAEGEYVPDLVATLGSLDTIMGEVDR